MRRIVCDFDGTLVRIPAGIRQDIGKFLNYPRWEEPNWSVVTRFGINPITIVTGRTVDQLDVVREFCEYHGIAVAEIYPTPSRVWFGKNPLEGVRDHKAQLINKLQPDEVFEDDATVLKMVECQKKYLVDHEGQPRVF